jgi:hypothetical protein
MSTEDVEDEYGQERGDDGLIYDAGVAARWKNLPFDQHAPEPWKRGWREVDVELTGDENAEF